MEMNTERKPRGARWAVGWTAAQQRGKEMAVGLEQSDPKEQGDNRGKSAVGRDKTKHPGPRQRTPGCVSGERGASVGQESSALSHVTLECFWKL